VRRLPLVVATLVACLCPPPATAASVPGTDRNDVLRGTKRADVIHGGAGNDVLHGRQGGDVLFGEDGKDRLFGDAGRDRLRGQADSDALFGGPGPDRLAGGAKNDRLNGGGGNDRLLGGEGDDVLNGGPGNDRLNGGAGKDRIVCGGGIDIVASASGDTVADDCEAVPVADAKDEDKGDSWSTGDVLLAALLIALVLAVLVGAALITRRLLGRPPPPPAVDERPAPVSGWLPYTLPFPALGILGIAIYSVSVGDAAAFASGLLIAGGAFLIGGLFGFLFGIPKSLTDSAVATNPAQARAFKPNTNLEDISDWLTKIIVGLTLVQFGQLIDQLEQLADFLAPSLGNEDSSSAFAIGILVLFSISGFLILYVSIRLYGREFSRAENAGVRAAERLRELQPTTDKKVEEIKASATGSVVTTP
jgi:RTX calcium-binding nonapeptide repeat (4 copies)